MGVGVARIRRQDSAVIWTARPVWFIAIEGTVLGRVRVADRALVNRIPQGGFGPSASIPRAILGFGMFDGNS